MIKTGLAPGHISVGEHPYRAMSIDYDSEGIFQRLYLSSEIDDFGKIFRKDKEKLMVVFEGFHSQKLMEYLKEKVRIHMLSLEDILHTHQRSKYETYEEYALCIVNMFHGSKKLQMSVIIMKDTVIVFQEAGHNAAIHSVMRRLSTENNRLRSRNTGFMGYALIDVAIDTYFEKIEDFETRLEELESADLTTQEEAKRISKLRHDVVIFRKFVRPLKEMLVAVQRDENRHILCDAENEPFVRDLQDHAQRITETSDAIREDVLNLMDTHVNSISVKMNGTMKVLTIITTIFVPITFLTSVYGMNFESMEEIHWKHGYALFWVIAVVVTLAQLYFFKKKKWM